MFAERLRFLEQVAALYEEGSNFYQNREIIKRDSWKALDAFFNYAYERQGASPAYAPAAKKVIQILGEQEASWKQDDLARQAWELYKEQLGDQARKLKEKKPPKRNEGRNPMCPGGISYSTEKGNHKTWKQCVIEFIQAELSEVDYNIVRWAEENLRDKKIRDSYNLLKKINGVGPKIASFFLRDVALFYKITPDQPRKLLQPIDLWVRRYVRYWENNDKLDDPKCAEWIVENSLAAVVSPEKINAGMWHFGSRVVGDRRALIELIDDVEAMRKRMENHVSWMESQVQAWRSVT